MTKLDKLIKKFLTKPSDITWDELCKILSSFGYTEQICGKTAGSRRKFIHETKPPIILHKPHPGNIVKVYQINQIIEQLKQENQL